MRTLNLFEEARLTLPKSIALSAESLSKYGEFTSTGRSPPLMRLAHLRELEEAYEKGWLLSTSELADLLNLSVQTVRGYGEQFEEAGFVFRRVGQRARGEIAWQVGKLGLLNAHPAP